LQRFVKEGTSGFLQGFSRNEVFDKERVASNKLPFRQKRFEEIILDYQIHKGDLTNDEFQQRLDTLYRNIDESFENVEGLDEAIQFSYYRMDLRKMEPRVDEARVREGNTYIPITASLPETLVKSQQESEKVREELSRHWPLKLWSNARYEKDESKFAKYSQYEENASLALAEAVEMIAPQEHSILFDDTPIYTSAVLLRDFGQSLSQEETHACTNILLKRLEQLVDQHYRYQFGDGFDVAIAMLPFLISRQSDVEEGTLANPIVLMLAILLDWEKPRKMAILAFRKEIYKQYSVLAGHIMSALCKLKPIYDQTVSRRSGISPAQFIERHIRKQAQMLFQENAGVPDLKLDNLDYQALQTLSMLVDSSVPSSVDIVIGTGDGIWSELFSSERKKRDRGEFRDYEQENDYIDWLAEYLLRASKDVQLIVLESLAPHLEDSENFEHLLRSLVFTQDRLRQNEPFWNLWEELFTIIETFCVKKKDYFIKRATDLEYSILKEEQLIITYAFAFRWWVEGVTAWHTLSPANNDFFMRLANELGYHPCIIYALSRVLNTVGYELLEYGIDWLSTVIQNNSHLVKMALPVNTEYYIEEYIQRYIHLHKNDLKRNAEMRKSVIAILNFLVEKGSTCGYMLRENLS